MCRHAQILSMKQQQILIQNVFIIKAGPLFFRYWNPMVLFHLRAWTFKTYSTFNVCNCLDVVRQHTVFDLVSFDHNAALTVFYTISHQCTVYVPSRVPILLNPPPQLSHSSHIPPAVWIPHRQLALKKRRVRLCPLMCGDFKFLSF